MVWQRVCPGIDPTAAVDIYAGGVLVCPRAEYGGVSYDEPAAVWLPRRAMRGLFADWYRAAALALADPWCLLARDMQQQEHGNTKSLGRQVPGGRTRRQGSFKHIWGTGKRVYNGRRFVDQRHADGQTRALVALRGSKLTGSAEPRRASVTTATARSAGSR